MKLVVILFLAVVLAVIFCTTTTDAGQPKVVSVFHSSEAQGGNNKNGKKYSEHKHSKKSGKKSSHDVDKAKKGEHFKELRKVDDKEEGGKKSSHHSQDSHKSFKKSSGGSAHGAKFQEGSKRNKNNYKKGFREKYHKDEETNHDSFYSNSHKNGEYNVFGKGHSKHSSQSSTKKQGGNYKKGRSQNNHAKSGKKASGHNVADKKGYQDRKGVKTFFEHGGKFAKKGGNSGGKQFHYDYHK